jgi:hypothetical protein
MKVQRVKRKNQHLPKKKSQSECHMVVSITGEHARRGVLPVKSSLHADSVMMMSSISMRETPKRVIKSIDMKYKK